MTTEKIIGTRRQYRRFEKTKSIPSSVIEDIKDALRGEFESLQQVCKQFSEWNITRGFLMKLSSDL